MNEIKIFAPASVANVSCGFDVLGFCLDPVGDEMVIRKVAQKGVRITKIDGVTLPYETEKNVAGVAAMAYLKDHPAAFGFEIEIYKKIKPGSGIGSSSASAAGAVFGINHLMDSPLPLKKLVHYAMAGEALASGVPHADNVAPVLLGGFTLVRAIAPLDIVELPTPNELVATVLHPQIELKTAHARAIIKKTVALNKAIQQWGNLAAFVSGLHTDDYELMGRSMVDEIIEPYRASLIPEFEQIRFAALKTGALGSGISGSGPSIFALSRGKETARNVLDAMENVVSKLPIAYDIFLSEINTQGIKILNQS